MGGRWVGGGWEVGGRWVGGGWEVGGRWVGGGWEVGGRWVGGGWEVGGRWERSEGGVREGGGRESREGIEDEEEYHGVLATLNGSRATPRVIECICD